MANKYLKKFSTFSDIEKRHSKTVLRIHFNPVRMAAIKKTNDKDAGEDVGKEDPFFIVGGCLFVSRPPRLPK